jgi:hypothetical protein
MTNPPAAPPDDGGAPPVQVQVLPTDGGLAMEVTDCKYGGTVVLTGMTVLASRYSGALAIDRLCVCTVSSAHLS